MGDVKTEDKDMTNVIIGFLFQKLIFFRKKTEVVLGLFKHRVSYFV